MNFLAHFHLAWPASGLVLGALEGDYLKGPLRGQRTDDIEAGVKLHRAVDAYTDSHPVVEALRQQFPPHLRRYAGILIDLGFDHYLSLQWPRFHPAPLADFAGAIYMLLDARERELGPGAQRMARRLAEYDILTCYHRWDAVIGTAERIGGRLRRGNALAGVGPALSPLRPALARAFKDFYPDLQRFAIEYRLQLNHRDTGDSNQRGPRVAPPPKTV